MLIPKRNRRADLPVVVWVFLVLFLCSASLFIFATSDKNIKVEISDITLVQEANLKQDIAEFYISEAIESLMISAYLEMLEQNKYAGLPIYNPENKLLFSSLDTNLNGYFYAKFSGEFKKKFANYIFQEEYLNNLKELIAQNKFSSSFSGENLVFETSLLEINVSSEKNEVIYYPEIFLNVSLNRLGLNSFGMIYNAKEKCKSQETAELMNLCLSDELRAFSVSVSEEKISESEKYFLVSLTSKRKFLIGDGFEQIKFEFVVV